MKLNLYPGIILYAIIPALISCSQNKETVSESPREEAPEIKELDINPLLVYNNGKEAVAVDVKIII